MWIVIAVVGVLIALQFVAGGGGYKEVKTSTMIGYIDNGDIKNVTFVDGDQQIRATLDNGKKVSATWVEGTQTALINKVEKQVQDGKIDSFNSHLAKGSFLGSLLYTLLPMAAFLLLFLFLMNNMQGGGGRIMQFAKSRA